MTLFKADITVYIHIKDCPKEGLPALDFRRTNGLPERLDNEMILTLKGDIDEKDYRILSEAGWTAFYYEDGSGELSWARHRAEGSAITRYNPTNKSFPALIPVKKSDSIIDLLVKAIHAAQLQDQMGKPMVKIYQSLRENADLLDEVSFLGLI